MTATEPRSAVSGAPARRGRRAGRRQGGGSRWLNALAGLVLVAGAVGLQALHMSEGEAADALVYTGAKGEDVDARRFTARVDSFAVAKAIQDSSSTIGTDNLFLVVSVSAKSSLKPYHMREAVLVTADGKKFAATDRVDSTLTLANTWVQPDIWVSGRFVFEVPASALPGASVLLGLGTSVLVESYRPQVQVDLGLDEEGARKLAASPQDVYSVVKK
ncbi:hypothetical protein [Nonomuraea gerenzanensis]|uniref:DUF4352 domain-containing protein n=1 Tax=Nonomuraea gerenzanensis TaxID=93944 RepID=A0A1M4DZ77_9ACTN|nr:hypothetical protein [Nonomuraea gerenzanensis]UBU14179.1 hypothetical protein LCN96_03860 [Nonomuraea gerenzanensis]SBO91872.1 hypothetical protein BN4615_P1386 [Nonomuraea gerenzanensis]